MFPLKESLNSVTSSEFSRVIRTVGKTLNRTIFLEKKCVKNVFLGPAKAVVNFQLI